MDHKIVVTTPTRPEPLVLLKLNVFNMERVEHFQGEAWRCFPYPLYWASQKDCLGKVLKKSRGGVLVFRGYRTFLVFFRGSIVHCSYILVGRSNQMKPFLRGEGVHVLFVYFTGEWEGGSGFHGLRPQD